MKNWKAWLCVVLIFLAGIAIGMIAGHRMTVSTMQKAARDPAFLRQMIVKRLSCKLDLTDDQRKSIEAIITDSQVSIRDLRSEAEPRFSDILKNAERQIAEVLNAEQQEEFRELLEERRKVWGGASTD
jgi:Spy/CpxP family protein refolding chaperone